MIGACIFMTAYENRDLMWMGLPIQTIAKLIVHSIGAKSSNEFVINVLYKHI